MTRRHVAGLLTVLCLLSTVGCADDPDGGPDPDRPDGAAEVAFPPSTDPVDTGGLVWASGTTVHLADGTDVDLGAEPASYVVGGDGVYFTTADGAVVEAAGFGNDELFFADRDGEVTSVTTGVATPVASPDGRHLAYLDVGSGEEDDYGTPQAALVVVDLVTGEEVGRSTQGFGDPDTDDLAALYPELEMGVRRVTDETAYVEAAGTFAVDLATGGVEQLAADDTSWERSDSEPVSPDGDWRIVDSPRDRDSLVSADGERIVPDPGTARWSLDSWVDDRTAAGVAVEAPGVYALLACDVVTSTCETVPGSAGEPVRFPAGGPSSLGTTLTEFR